MAISIEELTRETDKLRADVTALQAEVKALSGAKHLEKEQLILTTYTKIIDVQMHFNEMVMRVRNLAVTLILAVFGAAAYSIQHPYFIDLWGGVHIAALIIAFGLAAWAALWIMDLSHFHLLLRGAVKKSTEIEEAYKDDNLLKHVLGMTKEISHSSRQWFGRDKLLGKKVTAAGKLHLFYAVVMLMGIVYFFVILSSVNRKDFPLLDEPQVLHLDAGALTIHLDQPLVSNTVVSPPSSKDGKSQIHSHVKTSQEHQVPKK